MVESKNLTLVSHGKKQCSLAKIKKICFVIGFCKFVKLFCLFVFQLCWQASTELLGRCWLCQSFMPALHHHFFSERLYSLISHCPSLPVDIDEIDDWELRQMLQKVRNKNKKVNQSLTLP